MTKPTYTKLPDQPTPERLSVECQYEDHTKAPACWKGVVRGVPWDEVVVMVYNGDDGGMELKRAMRDVSLYELFKREWKSSEVLSRDGRVD